MSLLEYYIFMISQKLFRKSISNQLENLYRLIFLCRTPAPIPQYSSIEYNAPVILVTQQSYTLDKFSAEAETT